MVNEPCFCHSANDKAIAKVKTLFSKTRFKEKFHRDYKDIHFEVKAKHDKPDDFCAITDQCGVKLTRRAQ